MVGLHKHGILITEVSSEWDNWVGAIEWKLGDVVNDPGRHCALSEVSKPAHDAR